MKHKKMVGTRVEEKLLDEIKKIAKKNEWTVSKTVEKAIESFVRKVK